MFKSRKRYWLLKLLGLAFVCQSGAAISYAQFPANEAALDASAFRPILLGQSDSGAVAPVGFNAPAANANWAVADDAMPAEGLGDSVKVTEGAEETKDERDELIEDLTKRLDGMEKSWDEYQGKITKEAEAKKKKSSYKMGGRLHMDYWNFMDNSPGIGYFEHDDAAEANYGTDPEDRFLFRRLRLEIEGTVPENMVFRIQMDFNNPSTPEYKDAYIGWTNLPYNQTLLLGNQKRPMGLDHLNSSRHNVFMERPFAVEAFNEDARRIGLAMYGHNDSESTFWAYGIYNLENTSTTGRFIGDSMQMGGYGRVGGSPWYDEVSGGRGYWHVAMSGAVAKPDGDASAADSNSNEARFRTRPEARSDSRWLNTGRIVGADWFETIGLESMLNIGSLQITSEYLFNWVQRDDQIAGSGPDTHFHGGYIFASYFLTGEHIPYKRSHGTIDRVKPFENFFLVDRFCGNRGGKMGMGALALALRYDYIDLTDGDIQGGVGHSVTGGLNWYWTAYSKLQTNLIYGEIDDHSPVGPTGTEYTSGDYAILGMRFMLDF
ncbi:Phosphate-selective porin O and P [Rosistilla carotiformis]|uniref:Phosphate-selective porin O and P n=1 Tax=Rosistilla carotiformis TaxID=2528017 RepID=A0A518JYC9_9BACT|nr:porin [Rosistilla carotiformis]QDV70539.1 Phosphate-selective porin O and P [Rosistilla carotiformis]